MLLIGTLEGGKRETFDSLTLRLEKKVLKIECIFNYNFFFLKTRCSNEYRMKNYIESTQINSGMQENGTHVN